jgi:outer membrane receptor protein involved in Fe transport
MQAGVKQVSDQASLYLTVFYGRFTGKPQQETLVNGSVVDYLLSANTGGIELESVLRPTDNWQISLLGDYMHSELTAGGPDITGNMVEQQPAFQMRVTPSYTVPTDFAQFRLFATGTHVGRRFSDPQNLQPLPAYNTLDIGVVASFKNGFGVQFTGSNVTNTVAITEGNVRVIGTGVGSDGVMLGRPLFGANYQLSIFKSF